MQLIQLENTTALKQEILELKKQRNALVLAHNYQIGDIQDVADYTGDSLQLARYGKDAEHSLIVFCGVHFMAESCSILSPEKRVLLPDLEAGCSLADSISAKELKAWKKQHPEAIVVMYVNTTADVKALTDYCVTSSNAVKVVKNILQRHGKDTQILFGPDMFLGSFVEKEIQKEIPEFKMNVWLGECHVHAGIKPSDIQSSREDHPEAEFLVHPECGCSTSAMEYVASGDIPSQGVHMLSTGQMLEHLQKNPRGEFIVATENGMLYPLQKAAPHAKLYPANRKAFCSYMKKITLSNLRDALRDNPDRLVIKVDDDIAQKAKTPIERMVAIG